MFKFKLRFLDRKLKWDWMEENTVKKEAWDPSFIWILVSNHDLFLQEFIFFFLQLEKRILWVKKEWIDWKLLFQTFIYSLFIFFTSLCSPLVHDYYWMLFDSWLPLHLRPHLKDVVLTLHKSLKFGLVFEWNPISDTSLFSFLSFKFNSFCDVLKDKPCRQISSEWGTVLGWNPDSSFSCCWLSYLMSPQNDNLHNCCTDWCTDCCWAVQLFSYSF